MLYKCINDSGAGGGRVRGGEVGKLLSFAARGKKP